MAEAPTSSDTLPHHEVHQHRLAEVPREYVLDRQALLVMGRAQPSHLRPKSRSRRKPYALHVYRVYRAHGSKLPGKMQHHERTYRAQIEGEEGQALLRGRDRAFGSLSLG